MHLQAFPQLTAWEREHRIPTLDEHLGDVAYHLETAERAAGRCLQRIEDCQVLVETNRVTLLYFYAKGLAEAGDLAVRAAASAVEIGLQITNLVLALGIARGDVKWGSLRGALQRMGQPAQPLLSELSSFFKCIGWKLLVDYRNWVTHRGAPDVLTSSPILPTEISVSAPSAERPSPPDRYRDEIVEAINSHVLEQSEVVCWPIVPPVHAIIHDEEGTPSDPATGIALASSHGLRMTHNRVSVGSLRENAASYGAKNPVSLGRGAVFRSGEQLERYRGADYIHAVKAVVMLANDVLHGEWDRRLQGLCADRLSASSAATAR
jgi:hypothetical protein